MTAAFSQNFLPTFMYVFSLKTPPFNPRVASDKTLPILGRPVTCKKPSAGTEGLKNNIQPLSANPSWSSRFQAALINYQSG